MVLNLRRLDVHRSPITLDVRVVDVPTGDFVFGEHWPPDSLAELGCELRDALGKDGGLGRGAEGDGVDHVQEVLVGEGGRAGEIEDTGVLGHVEQLGEDLCDVDDLNRV